MVRVWVSVWVRAKIMVSSDCQGKIGDRVREKLGLGLCYG